MTPRQFTHSLAALGLGFSLYAGASAQHGAMHHAAPMQSSVDQSCSAAQRRCVLGDVGVIEVQGDLKPEAPTRLRLSLNQAVKQAPYVTLSMPSMDMGQLRYKMTRINDSTWDAVLLLPVCLHGDVLWTMDVALGDQSYRQQLILQKNKP